MKIILQFLVLTFSFVGFSQVPTNGLIMEYTFNSNVTDGSGNGYNGQSFGGISYVENRFGTPNKAISLDGLDDYVDFGNDVDISTGNFTIEAWINLRSYDNVQSTYLHRIFGKGLSTFGTPIGNGFGLYIGHLNNDFVARFSIGNLGTYYGLNYQNPPLNRWVHIVGVRSGNKLILYIDGNLVNQISIPSNMDLHSNLNHSVGAVVRNTTGLIDSHLDGVIDVCRLYNRALSHSEIISLYEDDSEAPTLDLQAKNEETEIKIYPNPANESFTLSSNNKIDQILVFNVLGKTILIKEMNATKTTIQSSNMNSGTYFVQIKTSSGEISKKLIINKN